MNAVRFSNRTSNQSHLFFTKTIHVAFETQCSRVFTCEIKKKEKKRKWNKMWQNRKIEKSFLNSDFILVKCSISNHPLENFIDMMDLEIWNIRLKWVMDHFTSIINIHDFCQIKESRCLHIFNMMWCWGFYFKVFTILKECLTKLGTCIFVLRIFH